MLLLDTNVVSELRKIRTGKADPRVAKWAKDLDVASLFISIITIHEIEVGVCQTERRDPRQGASLRAWLENQVLPAFDGRILPVDVEIGRQAAQLHVPNPQPILDAMIAATALVHGMTVVTRNTEDFLGCGAQILNPWL